MLGVGARSLDILEVSLDELGVGSLFMQLLYHLRAFLRGPTSDDDVLRTALHRLMTTYGYTAAHIHAATRGSCVAISSPIPCVDPVMTQTLPSSDVLEAWLVKKRPWPT